MVIGTEIKPLHILDVPKNTASLLKEQVARPSHADFGKLFTGFSGCVCNMN